MLGTASPVHQMLETAVSQDPTRSPRSSPKVDNLVSSPLNRPKREVVGDGSVTLKGRPCNKLKSGGWKSAAFVYGLTLRDSVAVIGLAANLATYLLFTLHILNPDVLANTLTNFMGVTYLLPLFWGFLSDAYLGKYLTICLSSAIVLSGATILTVQSATPTMLPPFCSLTRFPFCAVKASGDVMHLFLAGLFLLAVGSAGVKPSMASLGHEQFDETDEKENKQRPYFFTGFYISVNLGALISITLLTWIVTDYPWKWGFGLITTFAVTGVTSFLLGTPFYRHQKPAGSPLTRLAQPVVAALRKLDLDLPAYSSELYELGSKDLELRGMRKVAHTDRLRFLDRAAIRRDSTEEAEANPWKLCTVTQVEDLKAVLCILPIWVTTFPIYTLFAQLTGFTIQQAVTLDRRLGENCVLPAPTSAIFLIFGALVCVATWELLLVPVVRRFTGRPAGFSDLQRAGVGLVASIFSMVAAALVEHRRVDVIHAHGLGYEQTLADGVPMSFFYLLPQYLLLGMVEFVLGVAQLNFLTREVPDGMKGVGTSLYFSSVAMGYFCSTLLVKLVNWVTRRVSGGHEYGWLEKQGIVEGCLSKFCWLLAAIITLNTLLFVLFSWLFVPREIQLNSSADCKPAAPATTPVPREIQLTSSADTKPAADEATTPVPKEAELTSSAEYSQPTADEATTPVPGELQLTSSADSKPAADEATTPVPREIQLTSSADSKPAADEATTISRNHPYSLVIQKMYSVTTIGTPFIQVLFSTLESY